MTEPDDENEVFIIDCEPDPPNKKIDNLMNVINILSNGNEIFTTKFICKKDTPWFKDMQDYSASPDDAIKRFSTYHPKIEGYDCQLIRSAMGFWCGFVYLPEAHPDYDKKVEEIDISCCYNKLVKISQGIFGFTCNGALDLIPARHFKDWRKKKATYKSFPFVLNKIKELALEFKKRE